MSLIENALRLSPLVGLMGHRQVGKTTLLERVGCSYHVLDTQSVRLEAETDPHAFLAKRAGRRVVLDECQVVPALFPELKEWVRTRKTPGQFILSGSVRFSSREAIRESLTGRIVQVELLPLTLSEILERDRSDEVRRLMRAERFHSRIFREDRTSWPKVASAAEKYLSAGGLPGVCFLRDEKQRKLRLEDQVLTILDRDLRMVRKITVPLMDLRTLTSALSEMQGDPLDYTELRRKSGISTPTIKKIIAALEAVFVIRLIPIEGGGSRGSIVIFEDLAERIHLSQRPIPVDERFSHLCFHEIRSQLHYQPGATWSLIHYRTRGGARVPYVFRSENSVLGVLPLESPDDFDRYSGSIRSFFGHFANAKLLGIYPGGRAPAIRSERVALAPLAALV